MFIITLIFSLLSLSLSLCLVCGVFFFVCLCVLYAEWTRAEKKTTSCNTQMSAIVYIFFCLTIFY